MQDIVSVLKATELHALKWFFLSTVNFTSIFTKDTACLKVVSAAEGVLGTGWHFRKGVRRAFLGRGGRSPAEMRGAAREGSILQRPRGAREQAWGGWSRVQGEGLRFKTDRGLISGPCGPQRDLGSGQGGGGSERTPQTVDQGCRRLGMVVAQMMEAGSNSGAD